MDAQRIVKMCPLACTMKKPLSSTMLPLEHRTFLSSSQPGTNGDGPSQDTAFHQYCVFAADPQTRALHLKLVAATAPPQDDGAATGFDTLTGKAVAKNVISVGAMEGLAPIHAPEDIRVTDFSSYGPTDDGRIKPDVVAHGDELISAAPPLRCDDSPCLPGTVTELNEYDRLSGTSMAAPVAAGIAALLNEVARRTRTLRRDLYSNEMKAVLIHTSASDNKAMAPSYKVGWGAIQAEMAGALTASKIGKLCSIEVSDSKSTMLESAWRPNSLGRVTGVWIDRPGTPGDLETSKIDDRQTRLVDDIDLILRNPDQRQYGAWRLDPAAPNSGAKNSPDQRNHVDNVERIDVPTDDYKTGSWTLEVTLHTHGLRRQGPTRLALAVYGFEDFCNRSSK